MRIRSGLFVAKNSNMAKPVVQRLNAYIEVVNKLSKEIQVTQENWAQLQSNFYLPPVRVNQVTKVGLTEDRMFSMFIDRMNIVTALERMREGRAISDSVHALVRAVPMLKSDPYILNYKNVVVNPSADDARLYEIIPVDDVDSHAVRSKL